MKTREFLVGRTMFIIRWRGGIGDGGGRHIIGLGRYHFGTYVRYRIVEDFRYAYQKSLWNMNRWIMFQGVVPFRWISSSSSSLSTTTRPTAMVMKTTSSGKKMKFQRINEQILVNEVTVIDEQGKRIGDKVDLSTALALARERHRDLVEVSSLSPSHSVCKLITPQERYEKEKKMEKLLKRSYRDMGKEFRLGSNIAEYDLARQLEHMKSYLEKGYTIKLLVNLRRTTSSKMETAIDKQSHVVREADKSLGEIGRRQEEEPKSVRGGRALEIVWRPRDKSTTRGPIPSAG
jgi:translation initiation factor IF-3